MNVEQKANESSNSEAQAQPAPKRCSRFLAQNQSESERLSKFYKDIFPLQGKTISQLQQLDNHPTEVTSVKWLNDDPQTLIIRIYYTNAKNQKRKSNIYTALEKYESLILHLIFKYFDGNGAKNIEMYHDFIGWIMSTWIRPTWVCCYMCRFFFCVVVCSYLCLYDVLPQCIVDYTACWIIYHDQR